MRASQIANAESVSTPHSTHALTNDLLDVEVLKAFEKVRSDDGSDILIELIDLYLQGTSQRIITMREVADQREWTVVKRMAHTLKGSSSTLGLRQIAKTCQDLEGASRSSTGDVQRLISMLESQFLEASRVLEEERDRRL